MESLGEGEIEIGRVSGFGRRVPDSMLVPFTSGPIAVFVSVFASEGVEIIEAG